MKKNVYRARAVLFLTLLIGSLFIVPSKGSYVVGVAFMGFMCDLIYTKLNDEVKEAIIKHPEIDWRE